MECSNTIRHTVSIYEEIGNTVQKLQHPNEINLIAEENFKDSNTLTTSPQSEQKNYIYLLEEDNLIHREEILKIFGKGGSKTALDIGQGRALIVPYMTGSSTLLVKHNWERMSLIEVGMSYQLRSIGLLSPESKLIGLSFSLDVDKYHIPALLSTSFDDLKSKGCYILEYKAGGTWEMGKDYLFQSDDDRFNESKWDEMLNPLLTDIAKLCIYNIPLNNDSLNLAIIKKQNSNEYEVRYFGFDFAGKSWSLPKDSSPSTWSLPKVQFCKPEAQLDPENLDNRWKQMKIRSQIKACLPEFIDRLICYEFNERYGLYAKTRNEEDTIEALKYSLIKKYTIDIFKRLKRPELYHV